MAKIQKVKIKGVEYPMWGGFYALEKFEQTTGVSSEKVGDNLTNSVVFIWCSLWAGAKMEEKEFSLTLDDFKAMVNEDISILAELRAQQTVEQKKTK